MLIFFRTAPLCSSYAVVVVVVVVVVIVIIIIVVFVVGRPHPRHLVPVRVLFLLVCSPLHPYLRACCLSSSIVIRIKSALTLSLTRPHIMHREIQTRQRIQGRL